MTPAELLSLCTCTRRSTSRGQLLGGKEHVPAPAVVESILPGEVINFRGFHVTPLPWMIQISASHMNRIESFQAWFYKAYEMPKYPFIKIKETIRSEKNCKLL